MVSTDQLPDTAAPSTPSKSARKRAAAAEAGDDQDDVEDMKSPTKKAKGKTTVKLESDVEKDD